MLTQDARAHVGAESAVAEHCGGLGLVELAEALPQRVERDVSCVLRVGEGQFRAFVRIAQVNDLEGGEVGIGLDDRRDAFEVVDGGEGGHVQRILGGAERRGVGEVNLREITYRAAEVQERRDHVETLVDARRADRLRAEDAARAGLIDQLERHRFRAGVVARVMVGRDVDRACLQAALEGRLQGVARDAGAESEDLDDRRAPGGGRLGRLARGGVFAHETTGAVGDARERDAAALAGRTDKVFRRIADGVDVGIGGALELIRLNAARRADAEARAHRELVVRPHPESENDHVGVNGRSVLQHHARGGAGALADGGEARAGDEADSVAEQFTAERFGDLGVKRGQHLPAALDQRDLQAAFLQLFRYLQSDEAGADHRDLLHRGQLGQDAVHVLDVAERMHALGAHARDVGDERGRAGGEDQLVVGLIVFRACGMVADADGLLRAVDREGLMAHADVHIEALAEQFGLGHQQLGPVLDGAADVVGQAAVGEGDVRVLLQHDDAGVLVHPARTGGGGGSAGDAADDEDLGGMVHEFSGRNGNGCSRGSSDSPHGRPGSGPSARSVRRRPARGRAGASGAG